MAVPLQITFKDMEPSPATEARIAAEQGCGFIETGDGQEVYSHCNSLVGGSFERMRVGDEVRLAATEGEKGPQASTLHRIGKHHPAA